MSAIRVEHLGKSFGSVRVLQDVNLTVARGECVAIIGPSGCGKSVFLRSLNLLEKPDAGRIFIGDDEITARGADINHIRKKMGMVYQGFHLFEHLNVLDNITLAPRKLRHFSRKDAEAHAVELLQMVGLEKKKFEMPGVLSGGQKQRIAIARCLAMAPEVMLFDEPTSALDPTMVGEVLATIRMLAKRNFTMLIVTHEMNFAQEVASRVLFFEEKGIYEQGTPGELFDHPRRPKTQAFIRKLKFLSEHIESRDFDLMRLRGAISSFTAKYGIDTKAAYRLQLCTEELVFELIAGCYEPQNTAISLNLDIEYSESEKRTKMTCRSAGKEYNPLLNPDDDDHLGMTILRRSSSRYEYAFRDGENIITVYF